LNPPKVLVIDYGIGNLLSVRRGFEFCGAEVQISSDPTQILKSSHIVLPGVGAFANAMNELQNRGLFDVVKELGKKGIPLMAICLGMQMLFDESEEFGVTKGLGIIPGRVVPIPSVTTEGSSLKIPHIGWNELLISNESSWKNTCLENVIPGESVYFVHSFMAKTKDPKHSLSSCIYGGHTITSVVNKDNVYGCQFHPEKSGQIGLKILSKFLAL
jgi:glutamine amidotransferase